MGTYDGCIGVHRGGGDGEFVPETSGEVVADGIADCILVLKMEAPETKLMRAIAQVHEDGETVGRRRSVTDVDRLSFRRSTALFLTVPFCYYFIFNDYCKIEE